MILKYPHPTLLRKATKVDPKSDTTKIIVHKLKTYVNKHQALGLAAPQLGISKQVAIASLIFPPEQIVLINPVVLRRQQLSKIWEGCLSMPTMYYASRPHVITFRNYDTKGNATVMTVEGKMANIVDHEMDHLNGICGGHTTRR